MLGGFSWLQGWEVGLADGTDDFSASFFEHDWPVDNKEIYHYFDNVRQKYESHPSMIRLAQTVE